MRKITFHKIKSVKWQLGEIGLFVLTMFCFTASYGQAPKLVKIVPPSPTAQAFQKYGDIPVSAYTGIPDISIPVYAIKFRDINVPISLSYHASGIKVSEEASQVGLGWTINTGGTISRNIVGEDDMISWKYFNGPGNGMPDFTNNYGPRDFVTMGTNLNTFNRIGSPTLDVLHLQDSLDKGFDFEPDQYYYSYPGGGGKFIMKRNKQVLIQKQEKIQIAMTTTNGKLTWQIKSTDGYIYDYNVFETYHDDSDHQSAWYLTKITSPKGNSIIYNYTTFTSRFITTVGGYSDSWDYADPLVPDDILNAGLYQSPNTGRQQGQVPGKNYSLVVLDNIDFNNGVVRFNYSDDREDLPGDKRLISVSIHEKYMSGAVKSQPLKTITLTQDYFGTNNIDDDMNAGSFKRLRLLSVQESQSQNGQTISQNPYLFTYNQVYTLPSKGSFARDHWGYYNGKASNTSLIPSVIPLSTADQITNLLGIEGTERDAVAGYTGANSLIKIQYPTGGSTEFTFENNDFDEQQSQKNDFSYFSKNYSIVPQTIQLTYDEQGQKKVLPTDTLDLTNEYVFITQLGQQVVPHVALNVSFRFSSNVCGTNPFNQGNLLTFDILDITGTTVLVHHDAAYIPACTGSNLENCMSCAVGSPVYSFYDPNLTLPPGKYLVRINVNTTFPNPLQDVRFTFNYNALASAAKTFSGATTTFATGGGQRIARIVDHDANNTADINVKKFIYHYFSNKDNNGLKEYSFGRRMSHPVYSTFLTTIDFMATTSPPRNHVTLGLHLMRSADSSNPLNGSASGAVVGYDQVTILNGENGENGKTVLQYINRPDTVLAYNDDTYNLPIRPPYGSNVPTLQNGSLIQQTDYTYKQGAFFKVKEIANTYKNIFNNENIITALDIRTVSATQVTYNTESGGPPSVSSAIGDKMMLKYICMNSQFPFLESTTEKQFLPADTTRYTQTTTSYYYDNMSHLFPTRVVTYNSKGEKITTINKYPLDYVITGSPSNPIAQGIKFLQTNNVISPVIEKYVQRSNADGSNQRTVEGLFTAYKPGLPVPDVVQLTTSVSPITNFQPAVISVSAASVDPTYKPYVVFNAYDTYGNVIQQQMESGPYRSYIWDYRSALPIAEVINATLTDIAYSSFEAQGTGNWTIASNSRDTVTLAITGRRSYDLAAGSVSKTGLNSATTYIISYWTKSAAPLTITGTSSGYPVAGATINGWTFYEHRVTGQSTITLSGTGLLDEVRLYPLGAQMTSYTYDALVGVTSITDTKGQTTYYEYDGLQRLINIKDQDGNILKHTDYHFQGQ